MGEWRYSTHPPSQTKIEAKDYRLPSTCKKGWKKKWSIVSPKSQMFMFYCKCGWKGQWKGTKARAEWDYDRNHGDEVAERIQVLPL